MMTATLDQQGKEDDVKHRLFFGLHPLFNTFRRCDSKARVDRLDIETETSKVRRKMTIDLRCWTSFQDGGHITLTWPMFLIILSSTR